MENDSSSDEDKPRKCSMDNRSTYSDEETRLLVDLIEKHKLYILNRATSAAVGRAKTLAWANIAKVLNSHQLGPKRKPELLKTEWEYLKHQAKKLSKDDLEAQDENYILLHNQIVRIINESDILGSVEIPDEFLELSADTMAANYETDTENDDIDEDEQQFDKNSDSVDDGDSNARKIKRIRSLNFTPGECNLLLKFVRQEKKYIISKECTGKANRLKRSAWARVAENFNKLSPTKRSADMLKDKFRLMKKMGSMSINKNIKVREHRKDSEEPIKMEDNCDPVMRREDSDDLDDDSSLRSPRKSHSLNNHFIAADPLSAGLNSDSGTDSNFMECNENMDQGMHPSDSKELTKLKMELYKQQLENAKLDKKRLEKRIAEESIESALRVRAARLEALAAAQKFPAGHPALLYTDLECRAQSYLGQFKHI